MTAMTHIAYKCKDKNVTEKFYTKHFGFDRARVFHHGKPNEGILLKLDNIRIELFNAPEEDNDQSGGEQKVGYLHLAFAVQDIEAAVEKLKADGVEVEPIIDCDKLVAGMRICFFNDPDGNRVELMEGYSDDENPPLT
jgi:glyoxylase I family protein